MARGRMLSKSISTSERRASLYADHGCPCTTCGGSIAEFAEKLYMLLLAHADDWGRQAGGVVTIKNLIDPLSPRPIEQFSYALELLDRIGLIQQYRDGLKSRPIIAIADFDEHQTGLHKRTPSKFPAPPERQADARDSDTFRKIPESPGSTSLARARGTELNRTELNGTKEGKNAPLRVARSRSPKPNGDKPNVQVLAAMVRSDVLPLRLAPSDLPEAVKSRAAVLRLPYDGRSIASAIASATGQTTAKRHRA